MRLKTILIATAVVAGAFAVSLTAIDRLVPRRDTPAPQLVALPPLPPAQSSSRIIAPVTIPLSAIRDAAERAAPRTFAGRADNPVPQLLQNADIKWTAARGPIAATGAQDTLSLATPLTGTLNVTGSLSSNLQGALGNALGGLLGGNSAKQLGSINIKSLNANADIRGSVGMTARPQLTPNWRTEPNLTAQVNLGDTAISIAGARVSVPAQVKPTIDRAVNDQLASVQQRIRNDPALEQRARQEWTKICRSIALQGVGAIAGAPALPGLWLELRPVRAVAAQPRIDADAVTLTLGLEAETRITSAQTQPDCPFPETLTIVPPGPGQLTIGLPIDLPFTEIDRIIKTQLVGRTFPEDGGGGAVDVTVKRASVAASGDRLLISLLVAAKEKKSFLSFAGEATVYIWGKPALDRAQQTLNLTNVELAIESEAAFGLLGTAARAAMPLLQSALAERTKVDLKPFAAEAQQRVAALIAELQKTDGGVRVAANITSLQLAGIAFDSKMLRVIAELRGDLAVSLTALPGL